MKKYVAAASLGAVLLVAPAVVGLNSAAADYQTAIVTSTGTTVDPVLAEYGTQPTVSASVSSTVGTPTGTITITVRNAATNAVFATKTGAANESPVTYTFPATTPGDVTYRVESSFAATGAYQSSTAPAKNVTTLKLTPTVNASVADSGSNRRWNVTVSGPIGRPVPTGTVTFTGGSAGAAGVTRPLVNGAVSYYPGNGNPPSFTLATYNGDPGYNSATDAP